MTCQHEKRVITGIQRGGNKAEAVTWHCPRCLTGGMIPWKLAHEWERAEGAKRELENLMLAGAV